MKTREAIRSLERLGARLLRQKGSHKIFGLPGGGIIVLPLSGSHVEMSPGLAARLRRTLVAIDRKGGDRQATLIRSA